MRLFFLLALVLLTAARGARADSILYGFSGTLGDIDVSGTLLTDGTTGVLTSSDIRDFSLTLTRNGTSVTSDATRHFDLGGSLLTATADNLFFDFGAGGSGYLLLFANDQAAGTWAADYLCMSGGPSYTCGGTNTNSFGVGVEGVTHATDSFTMRHNVASALAITPEPSSLLLLGTGLLGAAAVLRRRIA